MHRLVGRLAPHPYLSRYSRDLSESESEHSRQWYQAHVDENVSPIGSGKVLTAQIRKLLRLEAKSAMPSQCTDKSGSSNIDLKSVTLEEMRQQVRKASENLFTVLQTIVSVESHCNSGVENSISGRVELLPRSNAEIQNKKLANINQEICLPLTGPPIEIVPNFSKPCNDDSDVKYLGISNTIKPVINQSAKCNTKSGMSFNEPESAANMPCINDTGITANLTCTGSPGLSAVAPFIHDPSMTANAAYTNTAGSGAATPYVQTVEPANANAPRVSAAAPCAQGTSITAAMRYMQSTSETVTPAYTCTSGIP
ncbi:hypothetical protein QAD02_013472 [Eretmocerus hayati]|uniref:Uncharacterized protein n=1 Tax=Eretmocerus hayati TaxID=131215 RepID=A0ACC2P7B6_9HYME|nr:hypothetical protein QAD02_013472 [Eretmocerus hayati]